jgi:magnesium chelatase family protein
VRVGAVALATLGQMALEESSARIRVRVAAARERQRVRYRVLPGIQLNADAPGRWLQSHGGLSDGARELLGTAAERLQLSARSFHRTLRVARTVADLAGSERVESSAVAEALMFRPAESPRPA